MKFIVEEKITQYEPLIFVYQGREYKAKPLTLKRMKRFDELQKKMAGGDGDAIAQRLVETLEGMDLETAKSIDFRIVALFHEQLMEYIRNPEKLIPKLEKKKPKLSVKRRKK